MVGDTCVDVYRYGQCLRLNPESPAPLFTEERVTERLGMAANVVANVESLGMTATLVTSRFKERKERFIDTRYHQQMLRVDSRPDGPIDEIDLTQLMLRDDLKTFDAAIISDYDKGFIGKRDANQLTQILSVIPVIFVDTKKQFIGGYNKQNVILKLNESEAAVASNPHEARLVVTLGDKGARVGTEPVSGFPAQVFDVCGAGDTFLAALTMGYLETGDLIEAAKFANLCASISVGHVGTYAVTSEDINREYERLGVIDG